MSLIEYEYLNVLNLEITRVPTILFSLEAVTQKTE